MNINEKLATWTDWETTILLIGKSLGFYGEFIELNDVPRYVFWSDSSDSRDIDAIQDIIRILLSIGFLEMRDEDDLEYRLNPNFLIKWNLISSGKVPPGTLPTRPSYTSR